MNVSAENYYQPSLICEPPWYTYNCDYPYFIHKHFPGSIFIFVDGSLFDVNGFRVVTYGDSSYMEYEQQIILDQSHRDTMVAIMATIREENERTIAFAKSYEAQQEKRREENFRSKQLEAKRIADAKQAEAEAKHVAEAEQARLAAERLAAEALAEAERLAALEAERLAALEAERLAAEAEQARLAAIDPEDEARRNYRLSEDVADLISGLQTHEDIEKFLPTFDMGNPSHAFLMGIVMLLYSWIPFSFKTVSSANPGPSFKIPDRESETGIYEMFIRMFLLVTKSIHRSAHKRLSKDETKRFKAEISLDPLLRTRGEDFATRYCDAGFLLFALGHWFSKIDSAELTVHSVFSFLPLTGNKMTPAWLNYRKNFSESFDWHRMRKFPFEALTEKEETNLNFSYKKCFEQFKKLQDKPFNLHHPFMELLAVVFNDIYEHLRSFSEFEFRPIKNEHELAGTTKIMISRIIEHFDEINASL